MKYVLLEEAELYFASRIGSDPWDQAADILKEKALNHAERSFERLAYKGLEVTAGYIFPRDEQTEIPVRFKEAVYEEALSLLNGNSNERELSDLHVSSSSVAGFSTNVDVTIERPWIGWGLTSSVAWTLIAPYLLDTKTFRIVPA
jgi:hypothetical protein